jgi:CDP-diacylglycerol--glycerol-3-phosphate 3-phosphatidyltransferase
MKHLPNSLTIARILLTPVFLVLVLVDTFLGQFLALTVFVVAAVSDYFDGMIARRYGVDSDLGRYLDPLADKILVLSAFCVLPFLLPGVIPWWAVIVIAVRDIVVTVLRAVAVSKGAPLRTRPLAKSKTAVQLTFLIVVLLLLVLKRLPNADLINRFAETMLDGPFVFLFLMVVVLMTVVTGAMYVFAKPEEQGNVT